MSLPVPMLSPGIPAALPLNLVVYAGLAFLGSKDLFDDVFLLGGKIRYLRCLARIL